MKSPRLVMRIHALARSQALGQVSTDDPRKLVEDGEMPLPKKSQAWGPLFRGKHWMPLYQTPSVWPPNHGRHIWVYRWID